MKETAKSVMFTGLGMLMGGFIAFWGGYVYGRHVEEKEWRQMQREGTIRWRPTLVPPPEVTDVAGLGCSCRGR
jgi:hypothetical protein